MNEAGETSALPKRNEASKTFALLDVEQWSAGVPPAIQV
jgi:hypothetical protein